MKGAGGLGKSAYVGDLPVLDSKEEGSIWKNVQLYNLTNDLGEKENLALDHPEEVKEMMNLLKLYIINGRSTKGQSLNKIGLKLWPEVQWVTQIK